MIMATPKTPRHPTGQNVVGTLKFKKPNKDLIPESSEGKDPVVRIFECARCKKNFPVSEAIVGSTAQCKKCSELPPEFALKRGKPAGVEDHVLVEMIMESIRMGNFRQISCEAAGVNKRTYQAWAKRAKEDEAAGKYESLYVLFMEKMSEAEKVGECNLVSEVRAGERNWQSRAWILERRFKERWSKEFSDQAGKSADVNINLVLNKDEDIKTQEKK